MYAAVGIMGMNAHGIWNRTVFFSLIQCVVLCLLLLLYSVQTDRLVVVANHFLFLIIFERFYFCIVMIVCIWLTAVLFHSANAAAVCFWLMLVVQGAGAGCSTAHMTAVAHVCAISAKRLPKTSMLHVFVVTAIKTR